MKQALRVREFLAWGSGCLLAWILLGTAVPAAELEEWPQFKYDARNSGNVPDRRVVTPLGLVGAIPLTDGVFSSPVVDRKHVYVVDGSGTVHCIDRDSLEIVWRKKTRGGAGNCNNVSSPALVGPYLHVGTTAGYYYVLDRATGRTVQRIDCEDPIFSAPVVAGDRVYVSTLGSRVYALEPRGEVVWTWDFVKEVIGFEGDRWSGEQWHQFREGRVTWRDHFCCSRNLAAFGNTVVIPSGGRTVFLQDGGTAPRVRAIAKIPGYVGNEYPATFGQSIGDGGEVYVQWHRRDNAGRVEVLSINQEDEVSASFVPGTETAINLHGLLSFASVSVRGKDVYRVRPEEGAGLCRHDVDDADTVSLPASPSICPPILVGDQVVHGGLDGKLYVLPLSGDGEPWTFETAFGSPITAPPALCNGHIYLPCEDGYLYVLGPDGTAPLPTRELELWKIRSPLTGPYADAEYDWYTNYGDMGCTNANDQGIEPPVKIKWLRRVEGTVKHLPVCGGGRMYTHTAEGQIIAVEQDTGRILWRRYWPGVYLSFTSPLYYQEKLLVPQAGLTKSRVRCLDAATGELLWEQPFTGSPSWSRQFPPVVHDNLAIYASGSGRYAAQGSEKAYIFRGKPREAPNGAEVMSFQYTHDNPYYPKDNRPYIWAWDLETGKLVWKKDFSEYGSGGNDCGIAVMDGKLYYSTFFGYEAERRRRRGVPRGINGLTARLDPRRGTVEWLTTDHYVTAGCTLSAKDGRLYLGGYNPARGGTTDRHILCLNADDGTRIWRSDPVKSAVNVVTVGKDFLFSNAIRAQCHILDKATGKIVYDFDLDYACTRFTLSGPYLLGANMDMLDLSDGHELVTTGPAIDSRECLGSIVSNGRLFYTSQASGLQAGALTGSAARACHAPWDRTSK
ncbi:MAG: PQQ-binding-like beta-propeller repeat protein [Planctomycetota bacterium]